MKKQNIFFAVLLITSFFLQAQTKPFQMVKRMGRGINLGNTLSAPVEGNWSPIVTEQYFIDVANAGFTNVRIPMDFFGTRTTGSTSSYSAASGSSASYTGTSSDYVVSSTYLDRIETVIDWALGQGLVTVLDFHGATLKSEFLTTFNSDETNYTHPTSAKRAADNEKFRTIWTAISNRFKNKSENLLFEIVNEPYFEVSEADMNTINEDVIALIRATGGGNTTRNIILTAGTKTSYETPTNISSTILTSDSYLIATFHYYKPFNFTSSSKDNKDANSWGTTVEKATIATHFDTVVIWSDANNVPVFMGEFGADNAGGYNYSTGDLQKIGSNTTGFADGGPTNTSRVEFHRYLTEQAINRGFSFAVWDAGPSSGKTVHKRTDANATTNYKIANFSVATYSPKSTTKSTTLDTSTWVDDVKSVLLSAGTWPVCSSGFEDPIIVNNGFECTSFDTNWNLTVVSGSTGSFSDAGLSASKTGDSAAKVLVESNLGYNKVFIKNDIKNIDLSGKTVTLKCYAKSADASKFKFQVKVVGASTTNFTSPAFVLQNNYDTVYEYAFDIEDTTTSIQVKVNCGNEAGTYYFDDFSTSINDTEILSLLESKEVKKKLIVYPIPVNNTLSIKSESPFQFVEIYSMFGQFLKKYKSDVVDVSNFSNGVYVLKVQFFDGTVETRKVFIKK